MSQDKACFLATLLFGLALSMAQEEGGDFAPLVLGNTWVYALQNQAGGFGWNPDVDYVGRRTLRVESSTKGSEGYVHYVISFRDSLTDRGITPVQGSSVSRDRPDTVIFGRFQVTESQADGILTIQSLGDPIPSGMDLFFRRRLRLGIVSVQTSAGDSLDVVSVSAHYHHTMRDSVIYGRNLGMLFFRRNYDLLGEARIPGYSYWTCMLRSFNGKPFYQTPSLGSVPSQAQVSIFSDLKTGRSWRYRGLRQQVLGTNSRNIRRDSVEREVSVARIQQEQGLPYYQLNYRDSLHHRSFNGQSQADSIESGTIHLSHTSGKPFFTVTVSSRSPETRDELSMLFKWNSLPEESFVVREIGGVKRRVSEYWESIPELLSDTLIHAEGIGAIRRTRILAGVVPGLSEHIDLHLVAVDGKPLGPFTVANHGRLIKRTGAMQSQAASRWRPYSLRDFLGRFRENQHPVYDLRLKKRPTTE